MTISEIPLLFTFRTRQEGGEKEILYEDYVKLLEKAARTRAGRFDGCRSILSAGGNKSADKKPSGIRRLW